MRESRTTRFACPVSVRNAALLSADQTERQASCAP